MLSKGVKCLFFPRVFLQITTLINHKDKPKKSERTLAAIHRVGQAVNVAVGRFVAVGEAIATENQELKDEMGQACFEARRAGRSLQLSRNPLERFTTAQHLVEGRGQHLFCGHRFIMCYIYSILEVNQLYSIVNP